MNKASRLQGISDEPLTAKGRAAAARLGHLLAPLPLTAAYASDRLRAVNTAQALLQAHPDVTLHQDTGLREYYFGGLEGERERRLIRDSLARYGVGTMTRAWTQGDRFAQLIRNFQRLDPTGQAESLPALKRRVLASLRRIVAAQPEGAQVLVVAHGVVLSAAIHALAPNALPTTLLKNTSVTQVLVAGEQWQVGAVNLTRGVAIQRLVQDAKDSAQSPL
jgi:probable phosphoglycerate mutase